MHLLCCERTETASNACCSRFSWRHPYLLQVEVAWRPEEEVQLCRALKRRAQDHVDWDDPVKAHGLHDIDAGVASQAQL